MSSSIPTSASAAHRPSPAALRQGPAICSAIAALMLVVAVPLTGAGWALPLPWPLAMVFRLLAFLLVGYGFVILRRLSILEREGLRLTGTIVGYTRRLGSNGSHLFFPRVRIEDPPFAGRQFEGDSARFPRYEHPEGSSHPVLAHPTREIFVLDRPERARLVRRGVIAGGPFLFFLPEIASLILWLMQSA